MCVCVCVCVCVNGKGKCSDRTTATLFYNITGGRYQSSASLSPSLSLSLSAFDSIDRSAAK